MGVDLRHRCIQIGEFNLGQVDNYSPFKYSVQFLSKDFSALIHTSVKTTLGSQKMAKFVRGDWKFDSLRDRNFLSNNVQMLTFLYQNSHSCYFLSRRFQIWRPKKKLELTIFPAFADLGYFVIFMKKVSYFMFLRSLIPNLALENILKKNSAPITFSIIRTDSSVWIA